MTVAGGEHTAPHWDRVALLTIDVQRDFCAGGTAEVAGTSEVVGAVARLAAAFRSAGRPVVHVVRLYLPDGSNADLARRGALAAGAEVVRPGTPGSQLAPGIAPGEPVLDHVALLAGHPQPIGPREVIVYKPRWNAFHRTPLDGWLHSQMVDTVVVAGCNMPNCPRATLFGASERDYRAVVVPDATSRWTDSAEAELAAIGVHAVSSDTVIGSHLRPSSS